MNCEETMKLMDGYLDGELDPITSQKIEQHLRECHKCEEAYTAQRQLVGIVRSAAPYHKASPELKRRIQSSLRQPVDARPTDSATRESRVMTTKEYAEPRSIFSGAPWNWLALAAAIILTAIIASSLAPRLQRRGADQFLATQLIASHVRSLMANHLTDIASSDQHTVKPWLDERLDFAAPVADFASEGFPLLGGRLDYLDNRPVAALVYQRRKHFINLFVWAAAPGSTGTTQSVTRQGYQLLHWVDSDFSYWAVSDVSFSDLQALKLTLEKERAARLKVAP